MKNYNLIKLVFLLIIPTSFAQFKTLNTSSFDDNYSDSEIKTLIQINSIRANNKLPILKTNKTLNYHSKLVGNALKQKNIDTLIINTHLIYYNDSLDYNSLPLNKDWDLIGLYQTPHRYKCNLLVVSLDKRKQQNTWKDLDCPDFYRKSLKN